MVKGDMAITDTCQEYEIAPSLAHKWKRQPLEQGVEILAKQNIKQKTNDAAKAKQVNKLYEKVGQLTIERDFLKKVGIV